MQASRIALAAALVLSLGGVALTTTGCAGTSTRESTGEMVDDSLITTKVKAAFVEDKTVSANSISVETYKGTVQLSGFASSAAEMRRAEEIARNVKGVKAVKNDIRLKAG